MNMENNLKIALLIDTENVSASYFAELYEKLITFGKVTYKRMYGDFTSRYESAWVKLINIHSITPVQEFSYTKQKNVTDSRLIIDAMDILYSGNVDAFCIMSSDSDFTGLVKRLKESNMYVIGAGETKTPQAFVNACDRFFTLKPKPVKKVTKKKDVNKSDTKDDNEIQSERQDIEPTLDMVLDLAINILGSSENSKYPFAMLVNKLYQVFPSLNFSTYGVKKPMEIFPPDKFIFERGEGPEVYISLK